jgi:hypothetical protein
MWGPYVWQFWYHNSKNSQKIDSEIRQIVVGIMSAEKEKDNGDTEQEFLGWGILSSIVDLLPHIQIVVRARIKLEGHPSYPMKHEERAKHV